MPEMQKKKEKKKDRKHDWIGLDEGRKQANTAAAQSDWNRLSGILQENLLKTSQIPILLRETSEINAHSAELSYILSYGYVSF